MRELTIAGRVINDTEPCYVIAELGHNHGGSLATAQQMITMAAACGADAIKLQKRQNQTLYTPALLNQPYENENSYGATYGEHRAALEFDVEQYWDCFAAAQGLDLAAFATAFDEPSAEFLARLDVPAFKIASGGLTDEPLVRRVASYGKPVILSTGAGDLADIDRAVRWLGSCPHALLQCTASYPLKPEDANLSVIRTLRARYPDTVIGFSSHSPGISLSLVAYTLGARILEHHVTLNRASKGTDHGFSLEAKGLETLVDDLEKVRLAMGDGVKRFLPTEVAPMSKMRRWYINGRWQIGTAAEQEPRARA